MATIATMEAMKMTTITISEKTRSELLKVAAELQSKSGKKMDYEDAIEYLIGKAQRTERNLTLFRAATEPKGVPSEELQRTLREGREEDRRHEESLERRYLS
jgi:hypothetical protein